MIYAFDTFYYEDKARTACIAFENWDDKEAAAVYIRYHEGIEEYRSGEFFKRELPCIMNVLNEIKPTENDIIIVDGYVTLNDEGKMGLGGYLYHELKERIPVIGVAKNLFNQPNEKRLALTRGDSKKPLYITAMGMDLQQACEYIKGMDGEYRLPTLLKKMDQLSRGHE